MLIICIRKNQTEKYWLNVLGDLLKIAEYCFPSLSTVICYEVKKKINSLNVCNLLICNLLLTFLGICQNAFR